MDKEVVRDIYIYAMEYYSAIKKEWNHAICSHVDGPREYHTKKSESEREKWKPYDITYTWNLKYDMNECIYERDSGT